MDPAAALQSALNPHGPEASAIATLTWVMASSALLSNTRTAPEPSTRAASIFAIRRPRSE